MGERRERTLPGRQDRWLVAKSPRAHRAPAPGRSLPPPPLNQVPGRDHFSLLQRVLPVQRLKQPGFSQLLFTCLDRELKCLFILHHPPPRAGKHQQKAGCPVSLLSPSQPPPSSAWLSAVSGLCSPNLTWWRHYWLQAPEPRKVDPESGLLRDLKRPSTAPQHFPFAG